MTTRMPTRPLSRGQFRLQKELKDIMNDPPPYVRAAPSSSTIYKWYFILDGPPDTPYEGGRYIGELLLPPEYPLKPPKIMLLTPSGRFEVGSSICLTFTDYHPEEWSPMWGVRTAITGLLSFMVSEETASGSIVRSVEVRKSLATASRRYNVEKLPVYKELFESEYQKDLETLKQEPMGARNSSGVPGEQVKQEAITAGRTQGKAILTSVIVFLALIAGLLSLRQK